ncbi:hypothetical protein [Desulfomonile tiedjei]|nr:hypothetical protein [Desulfomonile tiedjei]
MMANEISTSRQIDGLLKEFGEKNKIPVRLVRLFGNNRKYVAGDKVGKELPTWRIELDGNFALFLESIEFPDHLVGDLITLADQIRNRLHEMGK